MNSLPSPSYRSDTARPRWNEIDHVLLDMDGTLLDLRFDNYFWLEVLPERYARRHDLSLEAAGARLAPLFVAKQGTLDWYCIDFWSRELSLDVAELKREVRAQVLFLPGAERFLQTLHARG
ncbi:MAG: haloacid dehalogenase, partial [Steroidobacteraceae bacterium]